MGFGGICFIKKCIIVRLCLLGFVYHVPQVLLRWHKIFPAFLCTRRTTDAPGPGHSSFELYINLRMRVLYIILHLTLLAIALTSRPSLFARPLRFRDHCSTSPFHTFPFPDASTTTLICARRSPPC